MRRTDLDAFMDVPFYVWAKDRQGRYVWANREMETFHGQPVVGKTDAELEPGPEAETLLADDLAVLDSGEALRRHERVRRPDGSVAELSVCKWADDLDGERCAFGISFVVAQDEPAASA